MIYQTLHYPRRVIESMQLIRPESWEVYYIPENTVDDQTVECIRNWAESHEYGRFIVMSKHSQNRLIEFERKPEYMEFALKWL